MSGSDDGYDVYVRTRWASVPAVRDVSFRTAQTAARAIVEQRKQPAYIRSRRTKAIVAVWPAEQDEAGFSSGPRGA